MKILLSLIVLFVSSQIFAEDLVTKGSWKMLRQECASGAPTNSFMIGITHLDVSAEFNGDEMRMMLHMSLQHADDYFRARLEELLVELKRVQAMPDNAAKFAALKSLNDTMASLDTDIKGFSCGMTSVNKYTYLAPHLHVGPNVSLVSDCPGTEPMDKDGYDSNLEVNDRQIKMIDAKPQEADGTCPKGDRLVTVFERKI